MKPKYFKTSEAAWKAGSGWVGGDYKNRYQDPSSDTAIKLVEFEKGFAFQCGDYGDYLTSQDLAEGPSATSRSN